MGNRHPVLARALTCTIVIAAVAVVQVIWSPRPANATITQGDFSVYGFLETRESGRWGEGGAKDGTGTPTTFDPAGLPPIGPLPGTNHAGKAPTESGGSFDFNHWDLVQARQLGDVRPQYHTVKNFKFLGRFDTAILRDADFFAFYRPWYDAFGSIKERGRAETSRDWPEYTNLDRQHQFLRDDLHEYYAQLNFNDWFSMRVGKQQVIWSEADALSGTEVTNPSDLSYHWDHFETPENLRKNLRMIKFNFILPDFLKTANNELEAFVIPGDYEGNGSIVNSTDSRSPYVVALPLSNAQSYNQHGQPIREMSLLDADAHPMTFVGAGPTGDGAFFDLTVPQVNHPMSNSLRNSEFGTRFSTLLPVGDGLQMSFIYLYEARDSRLGICTACTFAQAQAAAARSGRFVPGGTVVEPRAGEFLQVTPDGMGVFGPRMPGVAKLGTAYLPLSQDLLRTHWLGVTGTYYEKNFTDVVYRYDALYAPKVGAFLAGPTKSITTKGSSSAWTEQARFILAGDRPTYIPWISKQHTFVVGQFIETFYPDAPAHATALPFDTASKLRRYQSWVLLAAVNWLMNGQLTSTNAFLWDADDNTGFVSSTNVYRYSRNILLGLNAQWYLGRSGRFTDPVLLSRDQRISELEFTLSYEI